MERIQNTMTASKIAPICVFLASDLSKDVTGQIFAVRKDEIFLMSQPRPLRVAHKDGGWTPQAIAETMLPAFKSALLSARPLGGRVQLGAAVGFAYLGFHRWLTRTMWGMLAFGAYVPRLRLSRKAVAEANAWFNPALKGLAKGERGMCNWDEDR